MYGKGCIRGHGECGSGGGPGRGDSLGGLRGCVVDVVRFVLVVYREGNMVLGGEEGRGSYWSREWRGMGSEQEQCLRV